MRYPHLAKQIKEMADIDQRARKLATLKKRGLENLFVYTIDGVHNRYIHQIVDGYGYPTKRLIGKEGMKKFWLLVQHQDFDIALQKACLRKCDFEREQKAYLTDRIFVNLGKKQTYGTQLKVTSQKRLTSRPIERKIGLDRRRKRMGLSALEAYIQLANERFSKKLGGRK